MHGMTETAASTSSSLSPGRGRRALRRLLGPLLLLGLALLLVLLAGIAWIAAHFNPQTQSRQLVEQVRARTGYLLTPTALPRLTFTPRLGLAWGPLLLESPADDDLPGTPARRVATAQSMHLTLDAFALLRGETQLRRVRIDGLNLWPAADRRYALPTLELSLSRATTAHGSPSSGAAGTPSPATAPTGAPPLPGRAPDSASVVDPHLAPVLSHALSLDATVLDATGQALPLRLQGQIGLESPSPSTQEATPASRRALRLVVQGVFDQTTIALDASRAGASPVLRFDLALGSLDLDHYQARPLSQPVQQTAAWQGGIGAGEPDPRGFTATAAHARDVNDAMVVAASPPVRAPETGTALRWVHELGLDRLDLQGTLRVASLQYMNVRLTHLRLQAQAQDLPLTDSQGRKRRRIDLNPLTASLYEGGVHGALRIHLDGDAATAPRPFPVATYVAAKLDLRDVRVGPLLRDALAIDWLEGRGNIALDLRSGGGTAQAFKRHLNGNVGVQLQNGSIGLNVAEVLRAGLGQLGKKKATSPPAPLPAPQRKEDTSRWRTPFERLRASFQIEDGVARSQDLNLQAPALRIGGDGTAWLAENRLDYRLRVTIAPAAMQQGSADATQALEGLQGLTVPLRLSGPFDDVQWRIAYADIAPTQELRKRLRGWKQDSLDKLRGLLPPGKTKN
jgi:hypothetical protein